MKQNGNNNMVLGQRVNLSLNSKQIEIIDSLIGEMGDNRSDVIKSIFVSWLSEKGISPGIVKKKLKI